MDKLQELLKTKDVPKKTTRLTNDKADLIIGWLEFDLNINSKAVFL